MYQSYIFMNLKTSGNPVSINIPGIPEGFLKMEHMGFEPTASTMRMLRAPNCANAPFIEKNGSNGARTHDLSRVRRTLIPAELCFHIFHK